MKNPQASDNPICNEVGKRTTIDVVNPITVIKRCESFIKPQAKKSFSKGLWVLIYNYLAIQRPTKTHVPQLRKCKNLTTATESLELKNTTSVSETFLGRFKQQQNEISQQINFNGGTYLNRCRQLNSPRHQKVSRYRLQER